MERQRVIVVDFGGQYNQLIARRIRDLHVYAELLPPKRVMRAIENDRPIGIVFTGGPSSVFAENAPKINKAVFKSGIPILGICYGMQLLSHMLGGKVDHAEIGEYGRKEIDYGDSVLFTDVEKHNVCWMSHTDRVTQTAPGFVLTAHTDNCPIAACEDRERNFYAVQFHPEVVHTVEGNKILKNFLYDVCKAKGDWEINDFIADQIRLIREKVGDKKVLCAMSGGVDSAVAATLVHKAIGDQMTCVFVDHGLLRKNEADEVMATFRDKIGLNLHKVEASDLFLKHLKKWTEPEQKRKSIGRDFIRIFREEGKKLGEWDFLVQGTIYPDVIESGKGGSATIKSHHNVGGLPSDFKKKMLIEPLRDLFKDEVRALGLKLGLSEEIVNRQPFPGPGLAIRIIGQITREKIKLLQDADYIFREEIAKAGLDKEIWQYFAVLTNVCSVGVMGDERTYDYTIALRAVTSVDGMTAESARIPYDVLSTVSTRIINEVKGVNRIAYDITGKPPATIEWE